MWEEKGMAPASETERRMRAPHAIEAAMIWAPVHEKPVQGERKPPFDINQIDIAAGWPPRIQGGTDVRASEVFSSRSHFTVRDQRASLQAALDHPEVDHLLEGRWEVLGCHLVHERATRRQLRHRVRVCLFNYTDNQLIEVYVENGVACRVRLGEAHQHPESPIEMAQAIALARGVPEIEEATRSLSAHAILQIPPRNHGPSNGHRCMLVMFTEVDDPHLERPVLYSAMVDLRLQRVLYAGAAKCNVPETSQSR
jgi:hypothetical protein